MADQQIDAPSDTDVDETVRALIHAEESARSALAEKLDGPERDSMREWLRPTLGAALLLVGAAGVAYKVISGYQHASPEAFVSVQDQNKQPAASAANHPVDALTVSADVATPPQSTVVAAPTAPITAAPPVAPGDALVSASSAAADADLLAQDNSACAAIKAEQHEIEAALNKQYSPEEGRYMHRRFRELTEQSVMRKCGG